MIFFFLLVVLVLIAQIAEFFIPALPWLYNAHVYIVPVIVFYGAMALPFPLMLALALYAGVLLDVLTVQVPVGVFRQRQPERVHVQRSADAGIRGDHGNACHELHLHGSPPPLVRPFLT